MSEFSKLVEVIQSPLRSFQLTPKCTKCKEDKDSSQFSLNGSTGRLRSWCKSCIVKKSQEYYLTHKRKKYSRKLRRSERDLRAYVMVRMDDNMKSELALTAKRKGVTMSKLVRDYIEWGMENDE